MWFKIVTVVWFVATSLVAFMLCCPEQVRQGWSLDTSEQNVAKIHSGMTLEEVERIIGGPPGLYVLDVSSKVTFHSAKTVLPNHFVWETYQGRITVRDGDRWWRELSGIRGIEPDGRVDYVRWEPYQRASADLLQNAGVRVGSCVFVSVFLYGVFYSQFRGNRPSAAQVLTPKA